MMPTDSKISRPAVGSGPRVALTSGPRQESVGRHSGLAVMETVVTRPVLVETVMVETAMVEMAVVKTVMVETMVEWWRRWWW